MDENARFSIDIRQLQPEVGVGMSALLNVRRKP